MLSYRPATAEQHDEFLQLMLDEAADYLERTMELMQFTLEQAKELVATVGQVYSIYQDERLAGFYWIEEREGTLHLHGLALKEDFQGKGIGTQVLHKLATEYRGRMEAIELGVHQSNSRAKALYDKLGYETVLHMEELGFYIMQKRLPEDNAVAGAPPAPGATSASIRQ
jgi:ribosomal protein S18 acetylase RimI-like enzyme